MKDYTFAIDPGTTKSGFVILQKKEIINKGWSVNKDILSLIENLALVHNDLQVVIEDIQSFGMAVGRDVFQTAKFIGAAEFCSRKVNLPFYFVKRSEVKLFLCNTPKAKDSNIRQAIIDYYGGDEVAIGGKKCKTCNGNGWRTRDRITCKLCSGKGVESEKGPLHGVSGHVWSALGVALTFLEKEQVKIAMGFLKQAKK